MGSHSSRHLITMKERVIVLFGRRLRVSAATSCSLELYGNQAIQNSTARRRVTSFQR